MSTTKQDSIDWQVTSVGQVEFQRTLRDLKPGQKAWIAPWGVTYDTYGRAIGVDLTARAHEELDGTIDVEVRRTETGWEVDLTRTGHKLSRRR